MRRASAELEKRRASLGAARGLRSDGTLDPYHAAILFRDSRGVSAEPKSFIKRFLSGRIYVKGAWPKTFVNLMVPIKFCSAK